MSGAAAWWALNDAEITKPRVRSVLACLHIIVVNLISTSAEEDPSFPQPRRWTLMHLLFRGKLS